MKQIRLFLLAVLICSAVILNAQGLNQKLVGSTANVTIVSQTPNVSYTIEFVFTSFQGYTGANIQVGDEYAVEYTLSNPKRVLRFLISTVTVVSGNKVRATLLPMNGVLIAIFPVTTGSVQRRSPFGMMSSDGSAPMYLDAAIMNYNAIRSDSLFANQFSHTSGFSEIAAMATAYNGQRLKIRTFGSDYLVQTDSIVDYRVDGKAVIKIPNSGNKYAIIQPGELGYDIRAFGAIPNDGISDDVAIQACIDFCILNQSGVKSSNVIIPPGNFTLTKGVVIYKRNSSGAFVFVGVNIIGTGITPYSGEQGLGRQSVLNVNNRNGFGIGVIKGRNIKIQNIAFEGQLDYIGNPITATDAQWSRSDYFRTNGYSPYSAIQIDFGGLYGPDADSYPDFAFCYGAGVGSGGTSQMQIDNCIFNRFIVAIGHSLSKNLQNGDNLAINNISTQSCKTVLAVGQDQTRGNSFTNAYLLFQKDVINTSDWGRGIGTPPIVRDLNIAGGTQTAFVLSSGNRAHFVCDNVYAESLWQLIQGVATPTTFSNSAFDFQFVDRQPTYHITSDANFNNCALKFYGGEPSHSIFLDGYCQFSQCIFGARGVYRRGFNAGGELTDQISIDQCYSTGRDQASNYWSQRNVGNQLLYSPANFVQSIGYPMDGSKIFGSSGSIEVWEQPLYNILEFGAVPLKVNASTQRIYLKSAAMAGRVKQGDVISTYTRFPSQTIQVDETLSGTPLGTVASTNLDTIFMEWTAAPYNLRDSTIGLLTVTYSPSSNLPFIASGTSGNTYLLVKTPHTFVGELRPQHPNIYSGTWVTRVSALNDTLFLSKALAGNITNDHVYFFKAKQTGVDRTNQDLVYKKGDEVNEAGTKYVVTVPGRVGTAVPPTFAPALTTDTNLGNTDQTIPSGTNRTITLGGGVTSTVTYFNDPSYLGIGSIYKTTKNAQFADYETVYGYAVDRDKSLTSTRGARTTSITDRQYVELAPTVNKAYIIQNIEYAGAYKKAGYVAGIDSVAKWQISGNFSQFDSVNTSSRRTHFNGFLKGQFDVTQVRFRSYDKSYLVSTQFINGSGTTSYDWIKVGQIDTDTTSNRISFYNGKIPWPNSATGSGNRMIQWVNGVPGFIDTPSGGGGSTPSRVFLENSTVTSVDLDAGTTVKDRDGTNTTFTFPSNLSGLRIFKNGLLQSETGSLTTRDYSCNTGTNTITFTTALVTTDTVIIEK